MRNCEVIVRLVCHTSLLYIESMIVDLGSSVLDLECVHFETNSCSGIYQTCDYVVPTQHTCEVNVKYMLQIT